MDHNPAAPRDPLAATAFDLVIGDGPIGFGALTPPDRDVLAAAERLAAEAENHAQAIAALRLEVLGV